MHEGHRERMRLRYFESGLDDFAPHEIIEFLLFFCIPGKNVNPLAHELLNAFGSLHGVFEASPAQLTQINGIGKNTAALLSIIPAVTRRYQDSLMGKKITIRNRDDATAYCRGMFIGYKTEFFYLIALNAAMQVVGKSLIAKGSLSEVPAYPRAIVEAVLTHNAHSVILCHNHLSDLSMPSENDVQLTERIIHLLNEIEVNVLDHIIVTPSCAISLHHQSDLKKSALE